MLETCKHVNKVWGYELWLVNNLNYCGKILFIDDDAISSYHCHKVKTETFYCLEGKVQLIINDSSYFLEPDGKAYTILPNEYHRFRGLKKSKILEISTHHEDEDVERVLPSIEGKKSWIF